MASEDSPGIHAQRNLDIYERRMRGERISDLAVEYSVSESRISQICTEIRRSLPDRSREELVRINHEQLEFLRDEVLRLVQKAGAPVTAGQHGDVLIDPDTGAIVRDYSLRINALKEAHRLILSKNKMLGLDAPSEVKTSGSVRYEIVGVDPEALT